MGQNLIFTNDVTAAIERLRTGSDQNLTVWIADVNTARFAPADARLITIPDGDDNKTLATVTRVWDEMERMGVTRHSLVINLGGGMVCDLGGFAAATFKRGVRFINVPTTLLGAVDAAVGGKTGFNYNSLKNEIETRKKIQKSQAFEINKYKKNLDEIKSAKTYKLWQKFAKLKRKFK